jgi:transcriptional regulator with XRE-family HTH domain
MVPATHEIDRLVGERIRLRREALGLSSRRLGQMLGLSYYQVSKYENGLIPISVSRLCQIAVVLRVPLSYFFADFYNSESEKADAQSTELQELVRLFRSIPDSVVRQSVLELLRSIEGDAQHGRRLEREG